MSRVIGFVYGVVCYAIFFVTFVYLIGFLGNVMVPKGIDDGTATAMGAALAIDLGLVALFGLQHSVMARPRFKAWLTKWLPDSAERSTFVLITSAVLVLTFWQWRPMTGVVWSVTDPFAVRALWALYALGFGIVLAATFIIDHFDLFGLRQVWLALVNRAYHHPPFRVTYFYRFVRHPIYLGLLIAFFSAPTMTVGRLVFAIGMTAYIMVGMRFEERDLVHFLGEDYRRYSERVPRLIPSLGHVHEKVKPAPGGSPAAR
jgi:protein-S-isoprenylcysteine O-methyltransferase Ste14